MNHSALKESLARFGVMPVIAIDKVEHALPLADALISGGLPIIEVTFRTAAAAEVIATISRERPTMMVGAGTVLDIPTANIAKACGASFAVAPGFNPLVVKHAQSIGLPFIPGVATPSDIEAALACGCTLLKFFPAEASGGVAMVEALSAPYKHTGVTFMPTGGITAQSLEKYLGISTVVAVGGTWLAKADDFSAGKWSEITARSRLAVETVARVRAGIAQ